MRWGRVLTLVFGLLLTACSSGGGEDANTAPSFSSTAGLYTADENQRATGYRPVASDADGDVVSFSLSGPDAARVGFSSVTGNVEFVASPDHEFPSDANFDNVYEFTVTASDGELTAQQAVQVRVQNLPELPEGVDSFALFTSADTPQLARVVFSAGERYFVVGTRDSAGLPTGVTSLAVENVPIGDAGERVDVVGLMRDDGQFGAFVLSSGERIEFLYNDEGELSAISATSADGEDQEIVAVTEAPSEPARHTASTRGGQRLRMTPLQQSRPDSDPLRSQAIEDGAPVDITVRECGRPAIGANVFAILERPGLAPTYPASSLGEGRYRAYLPVAHRPGPAFEQQCEATFENARDACRAAGQAGGFRGAAAACLTLRVPLLVAACEVSVGIAAGYCKFAARPADAFRDDICSAASELRDEMADATVTYSAEAYLSGGGRGRSGTQTASRFGPYPPLVIEATDLSSPALSVSVSPVDPAPGQGYTVLISASCRANAQRIDVSVSGTDGYSDSASCPLENSEGSCSLVVPGAAAGVADTITISAGTATRTVVVVF